MGVDHRHSSRRCDLEVIRQQRSEEALARIDRAVAESADRWARRWDLN